MYSLIRDYDGLFILKFNKVIKSISVNLEEVLLDYK